jgi:hypothetical protein
VIKKPSRPWIADQYLSYGPVATTKYLEGVRPNYRIRAAMVADLILDNSSRDAKAGNKIRVGYRHGV